MSHDRAFLDNVVTSTLVFEGGGKIKEYVGGYDDWQRQKKVTIIPSSIIAKEKKPQEKIRTDKKLSYNETRELVELPKKIELLEAEQLTLQQATIEEGFYKQSPEKVSVTLEKLKTTAARLEEAYQRWAELDKK